MSLRTNNPRHIANKRTGGKRTKEQIESDKVFCADLFVKGYAYREIAKRLNEYNRERGLDYEITYKTVYYDIDKVLQEWKKERFETVDNYIQLELKKLDKMEVELWQAWETSKGSKKKTKIKGGIVEDGIASKGELAERTLETTNGDPRYLDLLLKVQERRAKLLGYNAPVKVDVCNTLPPEENPANTTYDISVIPDDVLVQIATQLQDAEFNQRLLENG